jgi:spermidine synthase
VSVGTSPAVAAVSSSTAFEMTPTRVTRGMGWYFVLFVGSGFCSILYELVWLRLAMAQFGVTTALVSMVLSMFMAGLGLGSWISGRLIRGLGGHLRLSPLRLYALLELSIAGSALAVPLELRWGRSLLEQLGNRLPLSSSSYYLAAGIGLAFTLIPWCACMGATIPVAMSAIRNDHGLKSQRSFSFLYLANVLGAIAGATLPLLLIEIWGFKATLQSGMLVNLTLFVCALALSIQPAGVGGNVFNVVPRTSLTGQTRNPRVECLALLFATGMSSMGMEVVWTRQFTPYLGTFVYSFALILALYLGATFLGSSIYRAWSRRHSREDGLVWFALWLVALFPLFTADPETGLSNFVRVLAIVPFSGLMGFVTPMLVDRWSEGDPDQAGCGYAVNIAGCIIGPLVAGFVLLPLMGEHRGLQVLAAPWLVVGLISMSRTGSSRVRESLKWRIACYLLCLAAVVVIFDTHSFEQQYPRGHVLRDSTATVLADGEGMDKRLFVNGVSITFLTPATKMMSALPLALLDHSPKNALVVCFGMGTTHRSMLSWGIDSTAVELDPSVPSLFWFFHDDGNELLRSPRSHVVIDDGRRFLERTAAQYDVIAIDPPPPTQAAASSLLYSREFYSVVKQRLRPHGIFQQWVANDGDIAAQAAMARSLKESFLYVRAFGSVPKYGYHLIASDRPIPNRSAAELARRLPAAAAADLVEWGPNSNAEQQFAEVLKQEVLLDEIIAKAPGVPALRDDLPVNEYYLLRQLRLSAY